MQKLATSRDDLNEFLLCCWPLSTSILRNAEFLLGLISGSSWAMNDSGWSNGEILELYLTIHILLPMSADKTRTLYLLFKTDIVLTLV